MISYTDNGCGIPPLEKEKIFLRSFGRNTGLGLFLIREILETTGISITETGRRVLAYGLRSSSQRGVPDFLLLETIASRMRENVFKISTIYGIFLKKIRTPLTRWRPE